MGSRSEIETSPRPNLWPKSNFSPSSPSPLTESPNTSQPSVYGSLRGSETAIRILDLPAIVDSITDSSITAQLRVVDLKDKPTFATLSYVWGVQDESTPQKQIFCNGYPVKVTRNCWSALQSIRRIFGGITIWVDSVCINQFDQEEKTVQVARMGTIYSSAQVCYIWLGEGTAQSDIAIDYLSQGGLPFKTLISHTTDGVPTGTGMAVRLAWHLCVGAHSNHHGTYFDGLADVLSRPWITRLWTLQEALLSQNSVLICGNKSLSWLAMVYAIEYFNFVSSKGFTGALTFPVSLHNWTRLQLFWLSYRRRLSPHLAQPLHTALDSQLQLHKKSLVKGWKYFRIMYLTFFMIWYTYFVCSVVFLWFYGGILLKGVAIILIFPKLYAIGTGLGLTLFSFRPLELSLPYRENEAIMMEIQSRKSFDAKDKYKGLLGVIGDARSSRSILNSFESLENTYQKLFIDLIHFTRSLDVLLFASHERFHNCPSWVIDWRTASQRWIKFRYWVKPIYTVLARDWPQFTICEYAGATPGSKSDPRFRNREQLVVEGRDICSLGWCSPEFEIISERTTDEDLRRNLEPFQVLMSSLETSVQRKAARELSHFIEIWTDRLEGPAWRDWSKIVGQNSTERTQPVVQQLKTHRHNWPPFFRAWLFHRKLSNILAQEGMVLVRCDGTYSGLGVAPRDAKSGDIVSLISGVSMPVILRKSQGGFKFIGPIFLPGTMNGEVWNNIDKDNLDKLVLI